MKKVEFRQSNMYCNICFINAVTALAGIDGVRELDVDRASKTIRLQMDSAAMGKKKIQELVNKAVKGGFQPSLARAN
jgi:copper chaperone CopZ